ncbi:MAG: 50S ribosomal protein L3 [Armatimonadetes bacterium]|nr:50S ribosomal protein L3 [Armatimonadota bacterium]MDE2206908.1 50S ribosomal protein L3 [Armatimonadota bacterium]
MVNTIIGRKVGMTQVFADNGEVVPVSVIEAGPVVVIQVKTPDRDGYAAVQVGFGRIHPKNVNRPMTAHYKRADVAPLRYLRELPIDSSEDYKPGQTIDCSMFRPGQRVKVSGVSKGKGFQGVVKRFHFHGGDMTHGSMIHRKPQSGGATDAARTFKGTRKPGHMGSRRVTVRGLRIVRVDVEKNLILIEGAIPGAKGGLVTIQQLPPR